MWWLASAQFAWLTLSDNQLHLSHQLMLPGHIWQLVVRTFTEASNVLCRASTHLWISISIYKCHSCTFWPILLCLFAFIPRGSQDWEGDLHSHGTYHWWSALWANEGPVYCGDHGRHNKNMYRLWVYVHSIIQGSLNYPFGGIKQCKCMVNLRGFPYNDVLFWVGTILTPAVAPYTVHHVLFTHSKQDAG